MSKIASYLLSVTYVTALFLIIKGQVDRMCWEVELGLAARKKLNSLAAYIGPKLNQVLLTVSLIPLVSESKIRYLSE